MTFGASFGNMRCMETNNTPQPEPKVVLKDPHEWADDKIKELISEAADMSDHILWWAWNMGWLPK